MPVGSSDLAQQYEQSLVGPLAAATTPTARAGQERDTFVCPDTLPAEDVTPVCLPTLEAIPHNTHPAQVGWPA